MYDMSMTITATEITWETNDGETFAQYDRGVDGWVVEIAITGRERPSKWDRSPSNERTWTVYDERNEVIAQGCENGLRNAKRAALQALDDYLAKPMNAAPSFRVGDRVRLAGLQNSGTVSEMPIGSAFCGVIWDRGAAGDTSVPTRIDSLELLR